MSDESPERSRLHDRLGRSTVPPALHDPAQRAELGLPADPTQRGRYIIELNLMYRGGVTQAVDAFRALHRAVLGADAPRPRLLARSYFQCELSVEEWQRLIAQDEARGGSAADRVIYKVWPDFPVHALVDRSVATVKGDAALRAYAATGEGIVWAVIDSGVRADHLHFGGSPAETACDLERHTLLAPAVADLHRDFSRVHDLDDEPALDPDAERDRLARNAAATRASIAAALTDDFGHGTHVAGIIAGGLHDKRVPDEAGDPDGRPECGRDFVVYERVFRANPTGTAHTVTLEPRAMEDPAVLRGVAPRARLVSLKVLDATGVGRASDVMRALEYIREELNGAPKALRVHGVNLSVGYEFDAEMFACGQSPLCVEVDRLVKSGVVVVVAAGNTGYGKLTADQRATRVGLAHTINDPGNAALAITVGATHRDAPHTYGVSYFSSKGPTGDGRLKPDLVAPGERITSCASGEQLARLGGVPNDVTAPCAAYVDDSGTSMAAPHVSGAIAAFLSIRREFILRPDDVKRIFLESATSLGRERYFEGHGLVDLMRAIQSV